MSEKGKKFYFMFIKVLKSMLSILYLLKNGSNEFSWIFFFSFVHSIACFLYFNGMYVYFIKSYPYVYGLMVRNTFKIFSFLLQLSWCHSTHKIFFIRGYKSMEAIHYFLPPKKFSFFDKQNCAHEIVYCLIKHCVYELRYSHLK